MPNMQLCAQAHSNKANNNININNSINNENDLVNVHSSTSPPPPPPPPTPSNNNTSQSQPSSSFLKPPRRGHTRKRSLSAPITPSPSHQSSSNDHQSTIKNSFSSTASTPTSTTPLTQHFPIKFSLVGLSSPSSPLSLSSRRSNALPIQIQRNPKHSQASPPMSSEEYQRKLNEELEKVDFEDITVSELKEMLRQRGKPATGKKAVLMQRLQEEIELVKAMKNNKNGNGGNDNNDADDDNVNNNNNNNANNNNLQYQQMITSPTTSSSGSSLQRCIANLHISSPPTHSRRFSPYGGVPSSPRIIPNGMNNIFCRPNSTNNNGFNNDDWQFNSMELMRNHDPNNNHENNINCGNNSNDHNIMIHHNISHQDLFLQQQQQQPSSAPATITEFDCAAVSSSSLSSSSSSSSSRTNTTTSSPIVNKNEDFIINSFMLQQQQQLHQLHQLQERPPSSTPAITTEFIESYDYMGSMSMNPAGVVNTNDTSTMAINPQMLRINSSSSSPGVENIKQEPISCAPLSTKTSMSSMHGDDSQSSASSSSLASLNDPNIIVNGMLANHHHHHHQNLAYQYQENVHDQQVMIIKAEDNLNFLNYSPETNPISHNDHYQQSTQHVPMQIELQQNGLTFGGDNNW